MSEPEMLPHRLRPKDPVQFRDEDHRLTFIGWTQGSQKYPTPWYECRDCGARFSEAYPTIMPPLTDCPQGRAA